MSQLIQPSEVISGGVARPTPADIRLDKALISPHIEDAEFRWVVPAIGLSLYDAMVADKGNTTAFTSTAYQQLWDSQLKALCANAVLYEASPFMVMQMGSNGLYTSTFVVFKCINKISMVFFMTIIVKNLLEILLIHLKTTNVEVS